MDKFVSSIILAYLDKHGIRKAHLAERLNESPQNLNKKLSKNDISTSYIVRISDALNHNFFKDFAAEYERGKGLRQFESDLNAPVESGLSTTELAKQFNDRFDALIQLQKAEASKNENNKKVHRAEIKRLEKQLQETMQVIKEHEQLKENSDSRSRKRMPKLD